VRDLTPGHPERVIDAGRTRRERNAEIVNTNIERAQARKSVQRQIEEWKRTHGMGVPQQGRWQEKSRKAPCRLEGWRRLGTTRARRTSAMPRLRLDKRLLVRAVSRGYERDYAAAMWLTT
jgi:hypothetical protein